MTKYVHSVFLETQIDPSGSEKGGKQHKYKLYWLCPSPSPYNSQLFRGLASDLALDLTVYYREWVSASRPWQADLCKGYKAERYRRLAAIGWSLLAKALIDRDAFFIISSWDHPTEIILSLLLGVTGRKFAVWTDTPNLSRMRNPFFAFMRASWLKLLFSRAARIMGTGRPGVDALKKIGAAENKLVNFPYFVDVTAYTPPENRSIPDSHLPIRFMSSGRLLNLHKGYDVAVRALAEAGRITGVSFEYTVAGTGPDEEALRRLADQLGISDQVRFLGWVEPDALNQQYDSAHVLIHPSPTHEPYGVAVIEAMAAGLPVLASDATCAALDRVNEGVNGFIHPAGNASVLATHIAFLLEHPEVIAQMGQKARETAEEWPIERGIQIIKRHVLDI